MIEIKLTIDDIDCNEKAIENMPMILDMIAESKKIPKFLMPSPKLAGGITGTVLKTLSKEQKDKIAVMILNKQKDKIGNELVKFANKNGFSLSVKDVSIKSK